MNEADQNDLLLPLTTTLNIIEILQKYFVMDVVTDKKRIKSTLEILSKSSEPCNWQIEIERQFNKLKNLLAEESILIQIAAELKIPIDELEKYSDNTSNLIIRNQSKKLDKDSIMYGSVQQGLNKKDARRLAYEILKNLEIFKGKSWAIRMILGVSRKHFHELQDSANKHGKIQPGLGAIKPSGETKHELNRILCQTFSELTNRKPLAIFEPTQGYGEATLIFTNYGLVISIEKNTQPYSKATETHKHHSVDLLEALREGRSIDELLTRVKNERNFKILMPPRATNAHTLIPKIYQVGWHFDVIDVDPFFQADIYKMVDEVFPLLADLSLLFVSVNPSPRYGRTKEIADIYGVKDTPEFRQRLWMHDCWRYIWKANEHGFTLIPILVHKCWTSIEQSGIDRLYFVAAKVSKERQNEITREFLDGNMLKQTKASPIVQYQEGTIPVLYFGTDVNEENPTYIPNIDIIRLRLKNVLSQLSATSGGQNNV